MDKNKIEVKFLKPRVRFSQSGIPYTLVEDIFHSEKGQQIISRMASFRSRDASADRGKPIVHPDDE
jgi:hypothetical protein